MATPCKRGRGAVRFRSSSRSRKLHMTHLQANVPQPAPQGDNEALKHHLLKMLVTDLMPLSTVKDAGFRAFTRALNPTVDLPSSVAWVRAELLSVHEGIKSEVKEMLQSVPEVALTAEMWTHPSEGAYLTASCHFIDKYWKRRSLVLETAHLGAQRDAAKVVDLLLKLSSRWGIAEKVKVVVSNMMGKGSMTESCEAKGWAHVRCFVCTLDVAFCEALALLDAWACRARQLLKKCRSVVRFFQHDRDAQRQLRANQETLQLSPLRLVQASEDTWLDVCTMLQRLSEQRNAINMVLIQRVRADLWLNDEDAAKIDAIVAAFQPLKDAVKEMDSDGYECISNIIPLVTKMQKSMARLAEEGNEVARAMAEVFTRHLGHAGDNRWMTLSTALDPRFKNILWFDSRAQTIEHKLQTELKAVSPSRGSEHSGAQSPEITEILNEYKSTSTMLPNQNPLDFWRLPRRLKKLSFVALKYLTVVSTVVPLRRAFNQEVSRRLHYNRCHLEPENVNLMLFLNGHWSIESSDSSD